MRKLVHDFYQGTIMMLWRQKTVRKQLIKFYADKTISLIILDVMMPKMDGWEVCKQIPQRFQCANYYAYCKRR